MRSSRWNGRNWFFFIGGTQRWDVARAAAGPEDRRRSLVDRDVMAVAEANGSRPLWTRSVLRLRVAAARRIERWHRVLDFECIKQRDVAPPMNDADGAK